MLNEHFNLQTFHFSDPYQQQIYKELRDMVGPGPAAFFRDACFLMANPGMLQTTAHIVGHCLREIESAIRQVFKPLAKHSARNLAEKHEESHRADIRAILQALKIPEDSHKAAQAWFELKEKLHRIAHRRGLDEPRPVDEIREIWDSSLTLLQVLLKALRENFLYWTKILDQILEKSVPTKEDLKKLSQEVPNNYTLRQYFFSRLESPEWLEPLWKRGFFKHPPKPERDEDEGTVSFPNWPEASYLARMAQHKPELVAEIIRSMDDTNNVAVLLDLVDALLSMPPEISARLIEKATRWVESPYLYFLLPGKLGQLPEKLGQLLAHWAKGNRTKEALRLARKLLDVFPGKPPVELRLGSEEYRFPREPRARFNVWEYEEILKNYYPELVRVAGLPALELLCKLLDKAIRLSSRTREDCSYIWRPAIEEHSQNLGHTIKDALVSAVRDAAELVVRYGHATVKEVIDTLESKHWKVFRRIALHILRVFLDQALDLAAERLTNRVLFDDVYLEHEYTLLLRECFPRLSRKDQEKILGWVQGGPLNLQEWKQWQERETDQQLSEEEVLQYCETWQRDWLARIGPEVLPEKWRKRYQQLVEKYGESEYSESLRYGLQSPKSAEELKAMSISEIVEFLKTWKPPEDPISGPSPEGLGRVLPSIVAEDPGRFAVEAERFKGLDPTYIRAILSGLTKSLRQGRTFDWEPVLKLCEWVLSQPREIPGRKVHLIGADPDWSWTRKAIADLLSTGLWTIPIDLREKIWKILKPLTDDLDPTPEEEQGYSGSSMDPFNFSLNTIRGVAMHAVIKYAIWVKKHTQNQSAGGFSQMPEVSEVLEAHLDPIREPSLAIRAVYGYWFPWLVFLDEEWARTHAEKIFPQDEKNKDLFEAAWNAYIIHPYTYDNVFEILRPFYLLAINRIKDNESPDKKLAEHLMVFYRMGRLSLDDPLLINFWEKAPDNLRAHALAFIREDLERTKGDIPTEILDRLKKLWEKRFTAAKEAQRPSDFEKEIAAFGWWFVSGKFHVDWALDQLLASLELVGKIEPTELVLETLAKVAETHTLKSVKCLDLIVKSDREGWKICAGEEHIRRILQLGMKDPTTKQQAERIIHYLGSLGFLDFKNLLS